MVSIVEKVVQANDKVPKDALYVPGLITAATDAIALIGAANFELNIRRRDNIKRNWTKTTSICVPAQYHLLSPCLATILNCPNSLKTSLRQQKLAKSSAEATHKMDAHKHQGLRYFKHAKSKGFGYKYRGQATNTNKQLYWKGPAPHTTSTIKRGGGKVNRSKKPLYWGKRFRMSVSGW